jgi:survival-of-motor-neuron-related-splicing factor 30
MESHTKASADSSQLPAIEGLIEQQGETAEIAAMRTEIVSKVAEIDATLDRLRCELAALEDELPQTAEPAGPKFDPEKHPLLRKTMEKQEPEKALAFSTGDIVEAQWTDRSWYKAKIQSILGSVSAPKYLVKFIEYDDTLTVDRTAVRPLPNKRKREAEPVSAPAPSTPVTSTPHVISGPASINPNAQAAKNNAASDDLERKPSRIANKQTLKKRMGTWQDFNNKAAKKGIVKKDSMFRTSTEAGSRVGFTGSGKGMTETHKRKRYDRKEDAEKDDDRY